MSSTLTLSGFQGRQIEVPTGLFINNQFVPSSTGQVLAVENPSTGERLGTISAAGLDDINQAVESAKAGFRRWKAVSGPNKGQLLLKLADLIERDAQDLASLEAIDAGVLYTDSIGMNIPQAVPSMMDYINLGSSAKTPMYLCYTYTIQFLDSSE